jgi:hypothetical protein
MTLKRCGWIVIAFCMTMLEIWAIFSRLGPMNFANQPILLALIISTFTASGLGGCWMLFRIVRHEKHLFPLVLVPLLIPNSFLWYYFERSTAPGKAPSLPPRKNSMSPDRPERVP